MQNASGVTLSLGNVNFSNPINPNQHEGWDLSEVVDGIIVTDHGVPGGFSLYPNTDVDNYLQLDVEIPAANLQAGQSIDYYIFNTSVYYSWNEYHSAKLFTMSCSTDGGATFTKITDYLSASTSDATSDLTYDTEGNLSSGQPADDAPLETHTFEYKVPTAITHLRYNLGPNAGHFSNVVISEVTSTVSAEVIPEPSSYALIAGLIAFACIAYRRKRTKA